LRGTAEHEYQFTLPVEHNPRNLIFRNSWWESLSSWLDFLSAS
jgi:hypothetical protein